jgi:hypothetical protein
MGLPFGTYGGGEVLRGFEEKYDGKRPLGRPKRRWDDNIKVDLKEIDWENEDWIDLTQDRDK